ncbi:MAG: hypothetical protein WBB42_06530 [Polyangiales bacterium]
MKTIRYFLMSSLLLGALALGMSPADGAAADKSPYVAPKDQAYIVFVKAGRASRKMQFVFYDEDLKCLSMIEGVTSEIIPVKPGKHRIYTMATNSHRMEFDVEAGLTLKKKDGFTAEEAGKL